MGGARLRSRSLGSFTSSEEARLVHRLIRGEARRRKQESTIRSREAEIAGIEVAKHQRACRTFGPHFVVDSYLGNDSASTKDIPTLSTIFLLNERLLVEEQAMVAIETVLSQDLSSDQAWEEALLRKRQLLRRLEVEFEVAFHHMDLLKLHKGRLAGEGAQHCGDLDPKLRKNVTEGLQVRYCCKPCLKKEGLQEAFEVSSTVIPVSKDIWCDESVLQDDKCGTSLRLSGRLDTLV